jgi:pimeloyl-ACP methyl ester carboxylesterase
VDEYLERPDARIAYSTTAPADAKHTLVVTHSLATSRSWEDEAGILDWTPIVPAGHRLVRVDSRGHGASTGAPVAEHYRWPSRADDLLAIGDAVSPGEPIDGLGESTGCGVLLWAASKAPDRFRRLVLVIPPTRGEARAKQTELYLAAADMVELRGGESWRRLMDTAAPAPILQRGGWVRPNWVPIKDELLPAVLRGAAASAFPAERALQTIRQPTLIITWADDPSHPTSTAEYLAEQIPSTVLEVATTPDQIRNWGHRVAAFLAQD